MLELIDNFKNLNILVFGDLMLDEWIIGEVERISPEAPVPVVRVIEKKYSPGGASNVALNLKQAGANVFISGIVGDDINAKNLMQLLDNYKINIEGILIDSSRITTLKSRIIARNQQVVRVDNEIVKEISLNIAKELTKKLDYIFGNYKIDAVIVSDYAKGLLTKYLRNYFLNLSYKNSDLKLFGGPKPKNIKFFKNFDFISLNKKEAENIVGFKLLNLEDVNDAAVKILVKTGIKICIITLGKDGLYLLNDKGDTIYVPSLATEVYDVSGAGDTLLSFFALSYLSSLDIYKSSFIANLSASIVIKKLGTATVKLLELKERIKQHEKDFHKLSGRNFTYK